MGFSGNLSNLSTLGDPVNPVTGAVTYGFAARAEHVNRIGEILRDRDVQYFFHPEQDNYRYFADPANPALDTVHRIQWVLANTDPKLFGWQIDTLHNWSGRVRFLNATTHQPDISVWALIQSQAKRVVRLAHQGRVPQHRTDRHLDRRPARERRGTLLPDLPAHADLHRHDRLRRGRPRCGAGRRTPQRGSRRARLQVHVRDTEGPEPALLRHRERQRPRRHSRSRPVVATRQSLRRRTALLAGQQALILTIARRPGGSVRSAV